MKLSIYLIVLYMVTGKGICHGIPPPSSGEELDYERLSGDIQDLSQAGSGESLPNPHSGDLDISSSTATSPGTKDTTKSESMEQPGPTVSASTEGAGISTTALYQGKITEMNEDKDKCYLWRKTCSESISADGSRQAFKEDLLRPLHIDKRNVSKERMRYISAIDDRQSCIVMGRVRIGIISAVFGSIAFMDALSLPKSMWRMLRKKLGRNSSRKKKVTSITQGHVKTSTRKAMDTTV